ncbi:MAG: long-chain fatty acid--CoA ligase [Pontiellaceae bacterium]|jgi:long-chain acyl-CoA synthetase|nr:long-chain fatty acid--CoA ligase [Pontiellaceae bacterium]
MNIVELIRCETAGLPEGQIAVRTEAGELSYRELFQTVETVAALLKEQGVAPFVRVGLAFPDSIDYIILSLAVLSLGAVLVPVSVSSVREVAEEILEKTAAEFLISSTELFSADTNRIDCRVLPVQGGFYLTRCKPSALLPDEFKQMEPAFIRFSSGTTGTSKGVLLSHTAIAERTAAADQALKITSADTVLWVLSMSFHFVVSILLFLRRGATIWLCSESFPFSFLSAVQRGDGTFIYATPFHYRTLIESKTIGPDALRPIRMAISTAMKLPPETGISFREKFGLELTEAYGIIEVGLPFVNADGARPAGSVGRALPGFELQIRSADKNGIGEVLLRGPGMYTAYLYPWQPRCTDDWFETGDTGRLDADGFLSLLGRSKNLINFAGMKVFPYEVEAVLERYPGVRASLVYPEAHPRYGQLPCAKVEAAGLTADELQRHCYTHLESYKVPKKIEFVDRLERTESGKIKRTV